MNGLMEETFLYWTLNGETQAPFLCSSGDEKQLLTGHMLASGLTEKPDEIILSQGTDGIWHVSSSKCSRAGTLPERLDKLPPLLTDLSVPLKDVEALQGRVMELDHGSGLHAILLWDGEKQVIGRDIGRHNAVEKAVGKALAAGMRLDRTVLCCSGRLSLEMLAKAAFSGIPVAATRKQVGTLCAAYADKLHMAVCHLGSSVETFGAAWRVTTE
ncbi:MAG: formate dehydrogenase accessory sulfurtransferase FdhD [Clostridia bacterium]|nr:formate dehydrogenase accessory sulfurtransferase FdhD [Clostridia bacterium]